MSAAVSAVALCDLMMRTRTALSLLLHFSTCSCGSTEASVSWPLCSSPFQCYSTFLWSSTSQLWPSVTVRIHGNILLQGILAL